MPVNNEKQSLSNIRPFYVVIAAAILSLCVSAANADEDLFHAADLAAKDGRLSDMQGIYEQILIDDPNSVRALTGKAAALAWQNRYRDAQEIYIGALALEPDSAEARIGLGYAYAWNGQYSHAHTEFHRALAFDSTHLGARKGIALTYLWSGEYDMALESLEIAASIAPQDAEIWEVTGYAHLEQHNNRRAVESFDRALALDPQRAIVKAARLEAYRAAPALELFVLAGSTSDADGGLRKLEAAHWPSKSTRIFARFDDTIGLDNPSIAGRGDNAHSYAAGASHQFSRRFQLQLEAGVRQLNDGDLNSVAVKGVVATSMGALTLGAQFGNHELGYSDTLFHGGLRFAITDRWYLEPALYLSESGVDHDSEWRGVIGAEYQHSSKLAAGAFIGAGRVDTQQPTFSGTTNVIGAWLRREFDGPFAVTLVARLEQTPSRDFSIVEFGLHYRLPGNQGGAR